MSAKKTKQKRGPRLTGKSLGRPEGTSGEATRERLLEVAATLFSREGLRGVSLSEIAGAAGISAPAVYNYFSSKDDLFIETTCDMFEEIRSGFAEAAAGPGSWHEKVARVLTAAEELYREDAVLQRLGTIAQIEASWNPDRYARIKESWSRIDEVFHDIIRTGIENGDLPETTEVTMAGNLLMSMVMTGIGGRTLWMPAMSDFKKLTAAFKTLFGIDPRAGAKLKDDNVTALPQRSA